MKININKKVKNYYSLSINSKKTPKYNTTNLLDQTHKCGVYSIRSEKLNTIYIGETITSFNKRWNQHLSNPMAQLRELLQQDDVLFVIEYICEPNKDITLKIEEEVIKDYNVFSNYNVLGGSFRSTT